jgi:O-antigen ligase
MDKKINFQLNPIKFIVLQILLIIIFSTIISMYMNENDIDYLVLIILLIFSLISCLILFLIIGKSGRFSLKALLLGIFIFLISIGRTSIGSIDILDRQVPIHLVVFPLILILYITQIYSRKHKTSHGRNLLNKEVLFAALFMVPVYASIFVAENRNDAIIMTAELSVYFLIYFVFSYLVTSYHLLQKLIWIYVITTSIILLNSIYHFFYSQYHWSRLVAGEQSSPNPFSLTLLFGFLFLFGLVIPECKWKKRIFYVVLLSLFSLGLFLTFSRGAWLSVSIGVIVLLLLSLKNKSFRIKIPTNLINLVVLLSIAFFGIIFNHTMMDRIDSRMDILQVRAGFSNAERYNIYNTDFKLIKDSPILGIGLSQVIIHDFKRGEDLRNPHSSYLGVWVGSGTFALVFFLLFLIQHGVNLLKIRKQINRDGFLGNIMFASFITFTILILFKNSIFDSIFWGALALQGAAINVYSTEKIKSDKAVKRIKN